MINCHIRYIPQPPNGKNAKEIFYEFTSFLKRNDINLRIYAVRIIPQQIEGNQQQYQNLFWNNNNSNALSRSSNVPESVLRNIHLKILSETPNKIARYQDYFEIIEEILVKPQEELFGVPNWNPSIRKSDSQNKNSKNIKNEYCYIYLYGEEIDKLKKFEDTNSDEKLHLFSKECQLKVKIKKKKIQVAPQAYKIQGVEFKFGYLKQKFYEYWSTSEILKQYNENILIQEITLEIIQEQVNLYFEIVIDEIRKINFKLTFPTTKGGNQKEQEGNLIHSNGGIYIEKKNEHLQFYIKVFQTPQCFLYENLNGDSYQEKQDLRYWRCQNFLICDSVNMIINGLIKQQSYLRFTVDYKKSQHDDFIKFCQMLEQNGYLSKYSDSQFIQVKKFQDYQKPEFQFNIQLYLNWMMVSSQLGRTKLIQIQDHDFWQRFLDQMKSQYSQQRIATEIVILKQKKAEKKDYQYFPTDQFLDIINKRCNKSQDDVFQGILTADLTPSGILPNYKVNDYISICTADIQQMKLSKGKAAFKNIAIQQQIIKLRLRDDKFNLIRNKFNTNGVENKILMMGYFRQIIRRQFNIFDRNYVFLGFDDKCLKQGEFYIINQGQYSFYQEAILTFMFKKLINVYQYDNCVVKCSQIQKIYNMYFTDLYSIITLENIQARIFEESLSELKDQTIIKQGGFLLEVKNETKIMARKKCKENNYGFKILQPQGKVSQDILKIMNDIAFENEHYCALMIRYKEYQGILVPMHNDQKKERIICYEEMLKIKTNKRIEQDELDLQTQIESKLLFEIQVIGIPLYKECYLKLYQILNLINLDKSKQHNVFNNFKLYLKNSKNEKRNQNKFIKIEKGAQLMSIYDSRLDPDEVFIKCNNEIIKQKLIVIFKKRYLIQDGIHLFQNVCSQENQELINNLSQLYNNVIVFSAHLQCDKFPYDQFDSGQKFIAIWDEQLIPDIQDQMNTIDFKSSYDALKYRNKDKNASNESLLLQSSIYSSKFNEKDWIESVQCQMIDYFCTFHSRFDFKELIIYYTKLLLFRQLYQDNQQFIEQYKYIVQEIKGVNLTYLWFCANQCKEFHISKNVMKNLKAINDEISNIEQEAYKYFSI